ncbi:MAG: hypothetical protein KKA19_02635 [Candidatus Margulisbacteria bacterium]|nr:hypothetical protein [Candidatus Margulisiibacteriota bacterium]
MLEMLDLYNQINDLAQESFNNINSNKTIAYGRKNEVNLRGQEKVVEYDKNLSLAMEQREDKSMIGRVVA